MLQLKLGLICLRFTERSKKCQQAVLPNPLLFPEKDRPARAIISLGKNNRTSRSLTNLSGGEETADKTTHPKLLQSLLGPAFFSGERCIHFRFVLSSSQQATLNIWEINFPVTLFTKGKAISGIWKTRTAEGHNQRYETEIYHMNRQRQRDAMLISQTSATGPCEMHRQESPVDLANQMPN